jgi:hypothetical protein
LRGHKANVERPALNVQRPIQSLDHCEELRAGAGL